MTMKILFWTTSLFFIVGVEGFKRPLFLLVDGFTEYISGYCRDYCKEHNIEVKDVLSPYTCGYLDQLGKTVPFHLRGPLEGDERVWVDAMELNDVDRSCTFCLAESDAGVSTAERIQKALQLSGNGVSPQLRHKYMMNERIRDAGLKAVKQCFAKNWEEAESFIQKLWSYSEQLNIPKKCIIKPYRGVASDGVYLCYSLQDAKNAFNKLYGTSRYGGGIQDAVLIQEYAEGPEYAVDTVTSKGVTKVVALWKYEKIPVNGAPFCYQCTNLVSAADSKEIEICEYCINCLNALKVQLGPTHTEIKYTVDGPRLIEVNARWHAQNFVPIVKECLGYDAVTVTMDSLFDSESFKIIPRIPAYLNSFGRIVHLISYKSGVIREIRHVDTINALSSVRLVHLPLEIGDQLERTVDIRTDCGYVLLINEDLSLLESDYRVITALQKTMFEVEESFSSNNLAETSDFDTLESSYDAENEIYEDGENVRYDEDAETVLETTRVEIVRSINRNIGEVLNEEYNREETNYSLTAPSNLYNSYPRPLSPDSQMLQSVTSPPSPYSIHREGGAPSIKAVFQNRFAGILNLAIRSALTILGVFLSSHLVAQLTPFLYSFLQ